MSPVSPVFHTVATVSIALKNVLFIQNIQTLSTYAISPIFSEI